MSSPIDIKVSLSSLGMNDQLSPKMVSAIQGSIETSLAMIKDRWQSEAQKKLHSTIPLYLMGLDMGSIQMPFDGDPFAGAVVLQGKLPNMLEKGWNAFDMKIGFGKSKRIKRKDNGGWYLTIPLRHSTPGGFMYGQSMPKDVYGVAKKLNPYKSGQGNTRLSWPGAGDVSWNGYQHKTNKYNGMVRIVKSYQKATQSQYMTFRRVSDKSDPMSWWHPGYVGIKIAQGLEPFARDVFVKTLKHNLQGI